MASYNDTPISPAAATTQTQMERPMESYWPKIKEWLAKPKRQFSAGEEPLPTCPICYGDMMVAGITPSSSPNADSEPPKPAGVMHCGHMACLDCLSGHLKAQWENREPRAKCPLCRDICKEGTLCRHFAFWTVDRLMFPKVAVEGLSPPNHLLLHPYPANNNNNNNNKANTDSPKYNCGVCLELAEDKARKAKVMSFNGPNQAKKHKLQLAYRLHHDRILRLQASFPDDWVFDPSGTTKLPRPSDFQPINPSPDDEEFEDDDDDDDDGGSGIRQVRFNILGVGHDIPFLRVVEPDVPLFEWIFLEQLVLLGERARPTRREEAAVLHEALRVAEVWREHFQRLDRSVDRLFGIAHRVPGPAAVSASLRIALLFGDCGEARRWRARQMGNV